DVLAYIRSSLFPTEVSFRRILNLPARGVGEKTIEDIEAIDEGKIPFHKQALKWAHENLNERAGQGVVDLFLFLEELKTKLVQSPASAEEVLNEMLVKLGYRQYVNQNYRDLRAADSRWLSVTILGRILDGMFTRHGRTLATLEKFIDCMELRDPMTENDDTKDEVQMMTLHACKGLEFPLVFLLGLEEDILPHVRLGLNIDEERRLFYVGVTRAQKHLVMTRVRNRKRYGKQQLVSPSRFLVELDPKLYVEMHDSRPLQPDKRKDMLAELFKKIDQKKKDQEVL
ncbi:MAG: ATP-binding domain-containing protein, partial [Bdellovibrionaceae bacterium]|nr:ATP-binding domain-containing protein [Pseudobdellovibrionaceae bacterium]